MADDAVEGEAEPVGPDPETIELLLEQAGHQIELQDDQWNSLRTKAAIVLASAGVIFGRAAELHVRSHDAPRIWLFVVMLALFLGASLAALIALLPNKIRLDPSPRPLIDGYWWKPVLDVRLQLLPNLADAYEHNQRVLRAIARPLRWAVGCLGLALLAFFSVVLLQWSDEWQEKSVTTVVQPAPQAMSASCQSQIPDSSTTAKASSNVTLHRGDSLRDAQTR